VRGSRQKGVGDAASDGKNVDNARFDDLTASLMKILFFLVYNFV
jgi:hypothetical protein